MRFIMGFIVALILFGCSNPAFKHDTKFPEGQNLYFSKCGGCHKIYDRDNYTPQQWKKIMKDMTARSKLKDNEMKSILEFLQER